METAYLNDMSLSAGVNLDAGIKRTIPAYSHNPMYTSILSTDEDASKHVENNTTNASVETHNNEINNAQDASKKADISIFKDVSDTNVPDFFVANITESIFMIFIVTAALLASARISNKYITFILFSVIALLISTEYGISMAIVFYALFFVEAMDIFIIILVILALIHIFVPIPGLVTESFNWNYVIEAVLGALLLLSINNTWRFICNNNVVNNNNNKYQSTMNTDEF
jgi:hypothetical protein